MNEPQVSEAKQWAARSLDDVMKTVKKAETKASFDKPKVFEHDSLKQFFRVGEKLYRIEHGRASPSSLGTIEGVLAGLRPELSSSAIGLLAKRYKATDMESFDAVIQAPHLRSGGIVYAGRRLFNAAKSTLLPNMYDGDAAAAIAPLTAALRALFPDEVEYWAHILAMRHFLKGRVANEADPEKQSVTYNQSIILIGPAGFGKSVYANYVWGMLLGPGAKPEDRSIGDRDMFNSTLYTAPYLHIEDQLLDGSMAESKVWGYIKAFNSKDSRNARAMRAEGTDVPGNWPLVVSANMGATFSLPDYRHHEDDACKMIYSAVANASDAFVDANPDRSSDGFEQRYGVAFRHWLLRVATPPAEIARQLAPASNQVRYASSGYINEIYKREITSRPDKYYLIRTKVLPKMFGEFRAEDLLARAEEENRGWVKNITLYGLQRSLGAWASEGILSFKEDRNKTRTYKINKEEQAKLEAF